MNIAAALTAALTVELGLVWIAPWAWPLVVLTVVGVGARLVDEPATAPAIRRADRPGRRR